MNIIVTGASGFIGRVLVEKLLNEGNTVFPIIRARTNKKLLNPEITDYYEDNGDDEKLLKFIKKSHCEGVIHLASYFTVTHKTSDITPLINSNVHFPTRIIDASCKANIEWFLNIGTFWEHMNHHAYLPVNLYASTKKAFEAISKFYVEHNNLKFITVKLNDTYGPNDSRNKIINLWLDIAKHGTLLKMSPGQQKIDIVHVEDVVTALILSIKRFYNKDFNRDRFEAYSILSKRKHSLRNLAKIFEISIGKKLNIKWGALPYRNNEIMNPYCPFDIVPGWEQKISIENGFDQIGQELFLNNGVN